MRGTSQQTLVDNVFTVLSADARLARGNSDRACAKARAHLRVPAVIALNDDLLAAPRPLGSCAACRPGAWWPPTPRC
jgi:hypothetical protein